MLFTGSRRPLSPTDYVKKLVVGTPAGDEERRSRLFVKGVKPNEIGLRVNGIAVSDGKISLLFDGMPLVYISTPSISGTETVTVDFGDSLDATYRCIID
jgi:hypothetical protein